MNPEPRVFPSFLFCAVVANEGTACMEGKSLLENN
jgi:hypothetical protein